MMFFKIGFGACGHDMCVHFVQEYTEVMLSGMQAASIKAKATDSRSSTRIVGHVPDQVEPFPVGIVHPPSEINNVECWAKSWVLICFIDGVIY
jgi:hypothetical protein